MNYKKHIFLLISLLLFAFCSAQADTITYDSMLGTDLNDSADNIAYKFKDVTKTPANVGEFQLTAAPPLINTFGYCVDIETPIWRDTFEYTLLDLSSLTNGYKAAWLLNKWSDSIDESDEGTALQLAIWEILYGNDFWYDPATTSDGVDPLYATYTDSIKDYLYSDIADKGFMVADLKWVRSDGKKFEAQNIIVQVVPEPATMLLFGFGLLSIGAIGRRKS